MPAGGSYLDYSGRDDVLGGGARLIPVTTPVGDYRVWVKRVGNNPDLKVLLLHGGPGSTHEYLEACDSYLPAAGVEYYYYDQQAYFAGLTSFLLGLGAGERSSRETATVRSEGDDE